MRCKVPKRRLGRMVAVAVLLGSCGGGDESSSGGDDLGGLQPGQCIDLDLRDPAAEPEIVPCDVPHEFEVVAVDTPDNRDDLIDYQFGGAQDQALAECLGVLVDDVNAVLAERGVDSFVFGNLRVLLVESDVGETGDGSPPLTEAICQSAMEGAGRADVEAESSTVPTGHSVAESAAGDDAQGVTKAVTFVTEDPGLWDETDTGKMVALEQHDEDAYAWSTDSFEGDLAISLTLQATESSPAGAEDRFNDAGCVVAYGHRAADPHSGEPYEGLSFCVHWDGFAIRNGSVYGAGDSVLAFLVRNNEPDEVHSVEISIVDDLATMTVDGEPVVSTLLDATMMQRSGKIGLYRNWTSGGVTFTDIRVVGSPTSRTSISGETSTTVATTIPTTATTTTVATAAPSAIPATDPTIVAGEHEFAVTGAGLVSAFPFAEGLGMVPSGFGTGDQVLVVEFDLLAGDAAGFAALEITVTDGEGFETSAFLAIDGGGSINLDATTLIESDARYEFDPDSSHGRAYAVPETSSELVLVFPSGEAVDLAPILR